MCYMLHTDYCSRCHRKNVPLIKHARNKTTQYYYCRDCNAARMRNYYNSYNGKNNIVNASKRMATKYPIKQKARGMVNYAVKSGRLNKPAQCEVCLSEGRIEGHHMDYNRPLDVVWLCTSCHADYHSVKKKMRD